MQPIVYICHPYGGKQENIDAVNEICYLFRKAYKIPVYVPFLFHGFMDDTDPTQRSAGLEFCMRVMPLCSYVFVCGDNISAGMADEIANAHRMGMEIVYDND